MRWVTVLVLWMVACGQPSSPANDATPGDGGDVIHDADEGVGFRVTLDVIGVRDPLVITLTDDTDLGSQTITVTEDGARRFPRRLPDGHAFSIAVDNVQPCMPATTTAAIAGADSSIAITCNGVIDVHTVTSNNAVLRFQPRFDPQILIYDEVFAPLLVDPNSATTFTAVSTYAPVMLSPTDRNFNAGSGT